MTGKTAMMMIDSPPYNRQQQQQHDVSFLSRRPARGGGSSSSSTSRMDPKRHRFQTKMSLALTAFVVVMFGTLSLIHNPPFSSSSTPMMESTNNHEDSFVRFLEQVEEEDNNNNGVVYESTTTTTTITDYSNYSCHAMFTPTTDDDGIPIEIDQCSFAKTCNDGEGIWSSWVFCTKRLSLWTTALMISPFVLLWLVVMFRLLGSTAEDYFSPSLEYFSVKAKLPPRFAGVTLLALGNGAADVSATVNAITSDKDHGYQMSLGALTGAAMFVGGVVSAVVILVAGGVPCRGALVRDVLSLFITMIVIWVHFGRGSIGPEAISLFLSLYGIFVMIVFVADAYHRGVVLPRLAHQEELHEQERQMQAAEEVQELAGGANNNNNLEIMPTTQPQPAQSALGNVLTALSNYDRNSVAGGLGGGGVGAGGAGGSSGWGVDADEIGQDRPVMLHGAHGIIRGTPRSQIPPNVGEGGDEMMQHPYAALEDATDRICAEPGPAGGSISYNWESALQEGKQELFDHANQVWDDIAYNGDLHVVEKFLLICELPFTFLRKVTVPIPCDGYYCRGLVALSMAVSPMWLGLYLWMEHNVAIFSLEGMFYMAILTAIAVGMGALILRFAPAGEGNMALFAATPIGLYGFIIGAMWVDAIADHLVKILDFIGILMRIPGPVIGLTILAWGNSVADLSANVAMARKGLANMAMTACFAGPVFNILIGLGLGFSALSSMTGETQKTVELSGSVVSGFVFVMLNCSAIIGVGIFIGQGYIPRHHGYVALTIYSIYVVTSVILQYSEG